MVLKFRNNENDEQDAQISNPTPSGQPISGPPVSTFPVNNNLSNSPDTMISQNSQISSQNLNGPPIPESGLPEGWTQEQWQYYGQKYLDNLNAGGN